jgi:hypothetical protein
MFRSLSLSPPLPIQDFSICGSMLQSELVNSLRCFVAPLVLSEQFPLILLYLQAFRAPSVQISKHFIPFEAVLLVR